MSLPDLTRPAPVSLRTAFWYWLKLGFISFGGPAGQIAMMHAELVERRRWISEQRFLHALNYCMLLPGPEATQLAIYIGWLLHKTRGGIVAGILFVLPSLVFLIALSWIYMAYGSVPAVAAVLYGIKPAVVAIVLAAAWRIGKRSLKNGALIALAAAAFIAITVFHLPFPLIVAGAALVGLLGGRYWPALFQVGGGHPGQAASYGPALIDDDTPTPGHARFSWPGLARVAVFGCTLGVVAWLALALATGAHQPLAQMGWFFTKAAMLTFGGAYAVLPYVYQGAVTGFHWLLPAQMIDGLALGETTPGPLIMVVAFVGFVGAWSKAVFGGSLLAAGAAGASVATFFTFLPSFLFILAGGPLVEATRDNIRMTAPLTAISAAVVGVIVSLAVFFGMHVFWQETPAPHLDLRAVLLGVMASIALLRYQVGTIKLILACAISGLVLSYPG
ncbi:chromate efflux transporter [Duganella sp. LX20W]|uniref:Chromate efflux transporter n=1 Tax=Rugamonas brunnea TaxID=2758569 RepID=A0A7W2ETC2_9BURK|nr:chromate efflux transporter [Rugamonas brunnea]MBA5638222.1 chromate efflux transporter [Rugamonas brunnea]